MTTRGILRDVVEVFNGTVPAKTVDASSGVRFFGIAEVSTGGPSSPRYLGDDVDLSKAVYLQPGDVVVVLLGDIGRTTLVDNEYVGAVLGRECAAMRVRAPQKLESAWLYAWTRSQEFRTLAKGSATGDTMPRLRTRVLEEFAMPLPDYTAQQRVADLVKHFDLAVSTTSTTLTKLRALRDVEIDRALLAAGKPQQ